MTTGAARARRETLLLWALTGFCVTVALAMLPWPMYWDHGIFVLVARTIRDGRAPYVAAFDVKGPLAYVPFAGTLALPLTPAVAVRVADLVVLACSAVVFELALRPIVGALTTRIATSFMVVGYVASGFIMTAQPDGWAGLLITAAAAQSVRKFDSSPLGAGIVYGLALGACCWIKPTFVLLAVPPLVAGYWLTPPRRTHLARALWGVIAGGAVVSVTMLVWLAWTGGVHAFIEEQWIYNRTVYAVSGSMSYGQRVGDFVQEFARGGRYFMLPVLIPGTLAVLADRGIPAAVRAFVTAIVVAGCVNLLVQGKLIPYQWLPITVPVSALAGIGFARAAANAIDDRAIASTTRGLVVGALGVAFGALALEPVREVGRTLSLALGRTSRDSYLNTKFYINAYNAATEARVVRYVMGRLAPAEPLGVLGLPATIPVLAERPVVSRFTHTGLLGTGGGPLLDAYRTEYMTAFARAKPRYVVAPASDPSDTSPEKAKRAEFPALSAELDRAYVVDTIFPGYIVWRRAPGR